jgi:hypothetical protein
MVRYPMIVEDVDNFVSYHKGRNSRPDRIPAHQRRFIAWDGEGMNLNGDNKPQFYVLFGCSTGDVIKGRGLGTFEICDFILRIGAENPDAIHVGFAFTYDMNMIVKSLHPNNLKYLHENGYCRLKTKEGQTYVLQMRRGKWFSVSKYGVSYDRKRNPHDKTTVRIFDIFGFFTCSFVKAVSEMLGPDAPGMDIVREGKAQRQDFRYEGMEYVEKYWQAEIALLAQVAEELRRRLYGAGLQITSWHGPGALASYTMKTHGIKAHMSVCPDPVREAARYGYAGGRFELFKAGRIEGPVYSLDINSAYPYAISQLPSLTEGEWHHVSAPARVARFGIYRIRYRRRAGFTHDPGPIFHRDVRGNISYPHIVEGWYWSPEMARVWNSPYVEIIEGWEYLGGNTRPFSFVREMYDKRREWKAAGNPQQLALKLCLNSLYGKMAQRVGYNEKTGRIPPWHQLEWAGWVTSYTRSMLYGVMARIPWENLIAVETDGIYTTLDPATLGIADSQELGGWESDTYDEIIYLQSGLAWLRKGDEWTAKRRGLDPDSMTLEASVNYAKSLGANIAWTPYTAKSTRFIGLGAALSSNTPVKVKHCRWETNDRLIMPGEKGKRIHFAPSCRACAEGLSAYDMAHDLVIRSRSMVGEMSYPHDIPWEKTEQTVEWREYAEAMGEA